MTEQAKQPERGPEDGQVTITRAHDDPSKILIAVVHSGIEREIRMTEHNAWRVFGMLAFMLGIKLPVKLLKAIKL